MSSGVEAAPAHKPLSREAFITYIMHSIKRLRVRNFYRVRDELYNERARGVSFEQVNSSLADFESYYRMDEDQLYYKRIFEELVEIYDYNEQHGGDFDSLVALLQEYRFQLFSYLHFSVPENRVSLQRIRDRLTMKVMIRDLLQPEEVANSPVLNMDREAMRAVFSAFRFQMEDIL